MVECVYNSFCVFFLVVDDSVWVGVEGVCCYSFVSFFVDGFYSLDGGFWNIVYVEDGWIGVSVGSMEWVVIFYGDFGEFFKVFFGDCFFYDGYVFGYNGGDVFVEEVRGSNCLLYIRVRVDVFFGSRDN